ncbi:MAG: hypothetical protein LBF89_12440 [Bacteroidales bacterium]|nr:hypothetical protein [Bacteroidales bacterium]
MKQSMITGYFLFCMSRHAVMRIKSLTGLLGWIEKKAGNKTRMGLSTDP